MSAAVTFFTSLAAFLALVGILVLVHEVGHYLAAKLQGFGVEAFALGMGPILWQRKGKEEAFQIRWFPVGGFVKLVGDPGQSEAVAEGIPEGKIFYRRKRWERFLVLVMGAGFNVLFAYGLFAAFAFYGIEEAILSSDKPRVGWIAPGSPSQAAGILPGDVLLTVDGRRVKNWNAAQEEILTLTKKPYTVTVDRGGDELAFRVTPKTTTVMKQNVGYIGLRPAIPRIVGSVTKDSPAHRAGFQPGDEILAVDGEPVEYWDQIPAKVAGGGPGRRAFTVKRGQEVMALEAEPVWREDQGAWMIGLSAKEYAWRRYAFPSCLWKAAQIAGDESLLLYRSIRKLITRRLGMDALSGPLSIAYIAGEVARRPRPIYNSLFFLAVFSLQLGLINLIPIPILDGGHIFVLGIEGALRRDLPQSVKERLIQVGLGLVLLLFGSVMVLDVVKFLR